MARKILLIRFSSIGDIVLTTPVIRCLRQQLPDAEIHYLTKSAFSGIVKSNPYVHRVYEMNSSIEEVMPLLKSEKFEFVADLHHNLRSLNVKSGLGLPSKSFRKLNVEKWLLVNFKWNRLPAMHIVDRYMETVSPLGVKYDNQGLDFFIPADQEIDSQSMPPEFRNGFIAAVIGAKHATKRLPLNQWIKLAGATPHPIVVLGGPEDKEFGFELNKNFGNRIWNTCGTISLAQSASLVRQARCVVTNDTGLMHIAAAFRKRIISVWGNTIPEFGMRPILPNGDGASVIVEQKGLSCRPCSKIGFDTCPKGHFNCMMLHDMEAIARQVNEWFGK